MPNIKSAKKRVELSKASNARNKSDKSEIATFIKKFKTAIANKDITTAEAELKTVVGLLDSAARKNIIHSNSAQRKSAHLAKLLSDAKAQ